MTVDRLPEWLAALGYDVDQQALHHAGHAIPASHPYSTELRALLAPDGVVRANAVFDVQGVPTVVFLSSRGERMDDAELDAVRQRLWNQNLVSIVLSIGGANALACAVNRVRNSAELLSLDKASSHGAFSAAEIRSGDVQARLSHWFDVGTRVDSQLLKNLTDTISMLLEQQVSLAVAQTLMGQILFISYLEHRGIVSDIYRSSHEVQLLHTLIAAANRSGIHKLITQLRKDFNGDFLAIPKEFGAAASPEDAWAELSDASFDLLNRFLSRVDIVSGQRSFWNYDFSFIPVELLSGLYESFLGKNQADLGAYYTPRNLAALAVDEMLATSPDPLAETFFDGACGSGILLTTTFRRLLAIKEAREKRQLSLSDRIALLKAKIFGGDVDTQACRVTAFSLYLSLLEGLEPPDIKSLQEREEIKLPTLCGENLVTGANADFFLPEHPFCSRKFSVVLSNPPWVEPQGGTINSADQYAASAKVPAVRRQIAGLFSLRALDFLANGGRVCLILPVSQFLAPTSTDYVVEWLSRTQPLHLMNFGDMQQLLFKSASHSCIVIVGCKRERERIGRVPMDEMFDYTVPKSDISLAFGRLTLASADRHRVQTHAVLDDPQRLVTLMWGDQRDLTLWTRLTSIGTYGDYWRFTTRWKSGKGVHRKDASAGAPVDAEELRRDYPYLDIEPLKLASPVLHRSRLGDLPNDIETVAAIGDRYALFDGPRILFPDGFSREDLEIRAAYFGGKACFTSSIGSIAGPKDDEDLLRFTAIYLRSALAKYFLAIRAYQVLCERNRVSVKDIATYPFFSPEDAPDPEASRAALAVVADASRHLEQVVPSEQARTYEDMRGDLDEQVFRYFGLSLDEKRLVQETVEVLLPSVRPRAFRSLRTPVQALATKAHLGAYANALSQGLADWTQRLGGKGTFDVRVVTRRSETVGPFGVVCIRSSLSGRRHVSVDLSDAAVEATIAAMREHALMPVKRFDVLNLTPDTLVWTQDSLYLVRPLVRRCWLTRTALRDAQRIVEDVQQHGDGAAT